MFRIVRLLSIGTTAEAELEDKTYKELVASWKKYGVTNVCEKKFDADSYDVKDTRAAVRDLTKDEREATKDALDNYEPDMPAILREILTFGIPADWLYGPNSSLNFNSTPLPVDLYKPLCALDSKGKHFNDIGMATPPAGWDEWP
mmetsp:Transcript_10973/g.32933  ORF Transcript_10973/g.32933 Transcript_10973/m.32933 type:complete len:145 (-) Transcript_10973:146-580(-)